jgi:hypothetical protein
MVDDFFRLSGRHGDGSYKRNRDFLLRWWTRANNGKLRRSARLHCSRHQFRLERCEIVPD